MGLFFSGEIAEGLRTLHDMSSTLQAIDPREMLVGIRKGTNGVSTNRVSATFMSFGRGTFWVLPLTYFYPPKSARAHFFFHSVKVHYFCSGPLAFTPSVRKQGMLYLSAEQRRACRSAPERDHEEALAAGRPLRDEVALTNIPRSNVHKQTIKNQHKT